MINPTTIENFAALFNCPPVDQASDSVMAPALKLFILVGWDRSSFICCLVHRDSTDDLLFLQFSSGLDRQTRDLHLSSVESSYLLRLSIKT